MPIPSEGSVEMPPLDDDGLELAAEASILAPEVVGPTGPQRHGRPHPLSPPVSRRLSRPGAADSLDPEEERFSRSSDDLASLTESNELRNGDSKARRYSYRHPSTKGDASKSDAGLSTDPPAHPLPIAELISTVWTLNQNLALYGQRMEADERTIRQKAEEAERLGERIAETESVNRDKDMMIADMQRKMDHRDSEINELQNKTTEKDGEVLKANKKIQELDGILRSRDNMIEELQARLAKRDKDISELQKRLGFKDDEIFSLHKKLQQMEGETRNRDSVIQNLERKMRSPDSQRAALQNEITRLEALLAEQKEDQDTMQKYYEGQIETLTGRMERLKQEAWANRTAGKGGPTGGGKSNPDNRQVTEKVKFLERELGEKEAECQRLRQKESDLKQRSDGLENLLRRTEMKLKMPLNVFLMSADGAPGIASAQQQQLQQMQQQQLQKQQMLQTQKPGATSANSEPGEQMTKLPTIPSQIKGQPPSEPRVSGVEPTKLPKIAPSRGAAVPATGAAPPAQKRSNY